MASQLTWLNRSKPSGGIPRRAGASGSLACCAKVWKAGNFFEYSAMFVERKSHLVADQVFFAIMRKNASDVSGNGTEFEICSSRPATFLSSNRLHLRPVKFEK